VRRIDIIGFLDGDQAARVVAAIRSAASSVDIRIDSEGGRFAAMVAIILEVEEHCYPVFTTVVGRAGSAAGVLAIAGDVRCIDRKGTLMLHYATPASREAGVEMRALVREYTQAAPADVAGWLFREKTFAANDAVRFGLADRIIDARAPDAVWLKAPPKRRPAAWLGPWRDLVERHGLR
jgi:ATP-dependent protease ClpP protease subunit